MATEPCAVSGNVADLTGTAIAGAVIVFTRDYVAGQDGSAIVPFNKSVTANGSGSFTVDLMPGAYQAATTIDRGAISFRVVVPDAASGIFSEMIDGPDTNITPAILTQAQAARDEAVAAQAVVVDIAEDLASGGTLQVVGALVPIAASSYGILSANSAAENDAAFATVPRGAIVDFANRVIPCSAVPDRFIAFNGSLNIGGSIVPLTRKPWTSAFAADPVVVKNFETDTFWPVGIFRRDDRDEWYMFVIQSPTHGEAPPAGRLMLGISQGGGQFTKWHTIWTDDQAPLYNGAAAAKLPANAGYLVVAGEYDGVDRKPIALISSAFAAPTRLDLEAEGITSSPFIFGELVPWPAEFGGGANAFACAAYAGTSATARILTTTNNGGAGTWAEVVVGGAVTGFSPTEPSLVIVPGFGSVVFCRGQTGQNLHYSINTGNLLSGTWSAWRDSGIPLGANVPHAVYHHGIIELMLIDREVWSETDPEVTPSDNVARVYRLDPGDVFNVSAPLPQAHTIEGSGLNRYVGYAQTGYDVRGVPVTMIKMGESQFSASTDNERAALALITPNSTPRAAPFLRRGMPRQIIDNSRFALWPYGTSFSHTTDNITASRWRYSPSGATPAGSVTREALTLDEMRYCGHGQRYGLRLDTTADPDDNNGLVQQWRGDDVEWVIPLFHDAAAATLVLEGFGAVPGIMKVQTGISSLSGGTSSAVINTTIIRPNVQNDGFWSVNHPIKFPRIPDGSDIQESSFAYVRIDNSTSLTAWDALLTRFEVWMGDEPGPRDAYDYAADVERCKGYGWTMPARTGATAVEISNMVYRAGGVTLWQGNYAYERNLILDAASVSFSDPAHFQISQGVTNYTAATISGGELAGSRRGFLLNATTASDPFADNSQAVLRVANDLAAITWETGY